MNKFEQACIDKGLVPKDIKNANIANAWALAWALTLAGISYAADQSWYDSIAVIVAGFAIHLAIGIKLVFVFRKFIKEADELERKIQLDALAFSVGVVIVSFSSYSILEKSFQVPELTPSIMLVILSVAYMVGIIVGRRLVR